METAKLINSETGNAARTFEMLVRLTEANQKAAELAYLVLDYARNAPTFTPDAAQNAFRRLGKAARNSLDAMGEPIL